MECTNFSTWCISTQKQTDVVVSHLSVIYYQFRFPLLSAFIPRLTERELLSSESLIGNFHQRVTSQHTINANELCTKAPAGSC